MNTSTTSKDPYGQATLTLDKANISSDPCHFSLVIYLSQDKLDTCVNDKRDFFYFHFVNFPFKNDHY